jgi:hypothetical protein
MRHSVEVMTCDAVNYLRVEDVIAMLEATADDQKQIIFNLRRMNLVDVNTTLPFSVSLH